MSQNRLPQRPALPPQLLDPSTPVYFDEAYQTWNIFRYDDVLRALTNTEEFSQKFGEYEDHPTFAAMWSADPPRHADLRAITAEPFRPQVIAKLALRIRKIAEELLNTVLATGTGQIEIISALARPLATRVICEILQVDLSNEQRFIAWVEEQAVAQSVGELLPQPDMVDFMMQLLQERREHPKQGLVDDLLRAQANGYLVAGQPLSDWDLIGYCWMLLSAGFGTTVTQLGSILLAFIESDVLQELHNDHSLIPTAIDEALRWNPSFPAIPMRTKKDCSIGGQSITAGQRVAAWLSSANRDPQYFHEPETFDIRRTPNKYLTFGWGRHYCLGAPLAQLELKIAIETILDKLPLPLQIDPDKKPIYQFGFLNELREAHLVFPVEVVKQG